MFGLCRVLILVLMEDTLRGKVSEKISQELENVLILVLMEDTLRGYLFQDGLIPLSLNPCFNGRYSQSKEKFGLTLDTMTS